MKGNLLLLIAALLTLSGCFSPSEIYHAVRASNHRSAAIPTSGMSNTVVIHAAEAPSAALKSVQQIVVVARDAAEASKTTPQWYGQPIEIDLPTRQFIETTLQRSMMAKGYRTANRMNAVAFEVEKAFPLGEISPRDLRSVVRSTHILLCTRVRQKIQPERYKWPDGPYSSREEWDVGTRVTYSFTLELLNASTTESLWTATGTIDTVFKEEPNHLQLLDCVIQALAAKVPAAQPSGA